MRAAIDDAPRHCRRSLRDPWASLRPVLTGPFALPESTRAWVVRLPGAGITGGGRDLGRPLGALATDASW
jgi:hypothetical protein